MNSIMNRFFWLIVLLGFIFSGCNSDSVDIVVAKKQSIVEETAAKQLKKYLSKLYPDNDFKIVNKIPSDNRKLILVGSIQNLAEYEHLLPSDLAEEPESFSVNTKQIENKEI